MQIKQFFVVKLNKAEMIENQDSLREVFPDRFDLCPAMFQPLPKGWENLRGFSVYHFNQRTTVQKSITIVR